MAQENRVVTVTVNPAIDQTLSIPNFRAGAVNRVQSWRMDAGGKGINVASFLADFGQPATATGFLGADNDEIFRRLFQRKGIEDRCVRIAGQTRIGIKISDEVLNQTTDINFPGEAPSPDDVQRLFDILAELAATREWFVLSGSMPPGVSTSLYADMVRALRGKKVVLDTSGEGFARAVSAGPWLIKPNVDELREFVGQPLDSHAAILAAARRLSDRYGIASVVVSMGKQGALFVEGNDALWAVPPEVQVKSTVGAGDAMVAGIVAAKIRGLSLADGARLATAFSATAISHVGHDLTSIAEVEAMRDRVAIRDLS
ncbi:MAG: 1-phosphofructokinase [Caldilineales bacterium]|nr:1-phosphofructokinase [Caldilineales bacterium]